MSLLRRVKWAENSTGREPPPTIVRRHRLSRVEMAWNKRGPSTVAKVVAR
jgi:hypothetical protein